LGIDGVVKFQLATMEANSAKQNHVNGVVLMTKLMLLVRALNIDMLFKVDKLAKLKKKASSKNILKPWWLSRKP